MADKAQDKAQKKTGPAKASLATREWSTQLTPEQLEELEKKYPGQPDWLHSRQVVLREPVAGLPAGTLCEVVSFGIGGLPEPGARTEWDIKLDVVAAEGTRPIQLRLNAPQLIQRAPGQELRQPDRPRAITERPQSVVRLELLERVRVAAERVVHGGMAAQEGEWPQVAPEDLAGLREALEALGWVGPEGLPQPDAPPTGEQPAGGAPPAGDEQQPPPPATELPTGQGS